MAKKRKKSYGSGGPAVNEIVAEVWGSDAGMGAGSDVAGAGRMGHNKGKSAKKSTSSSSKGKGSNTLKNPPPKKKK